jgi:hypothetical protein
MAQAIAWNGQTWQKLAAPALIVVVLAMMILPLPPFLLDILFTFNIALAMIVLLIGLYTLRPLDFSVFPPCCWSPRCSGCRSTSPRPASCSWKDTPAQMRRAR